MKRKRRAQPTSFARQLRRDSTAAERRLWQYLRDRQLAGVKFRRQVPIGPYIVDFAAVEEKLVIEVDGGQHADDGPERTEELKRAGYRVIRLWNNDVLERTEGVLNAIRMALPRPSR